MLVQHKVFVCGVGEEVDLFYAVFDQAMDKFITESFLVRLSKSGAPLDPTRFDKMACVFAVRLPKPMFLVGLCVCVCVCMRSVEEETRHA